ncbi:hypothetical protein THAOC_33306, partial [Thalassiosira oceanica]
YNASDTKWYLEADIFAADGEPGDAFGVSVALNANRAIVGANQDDTDFGGVSVGSAYLFQLGNETGWKQEAKLGNSDGMGGDGFGAEVAIHRNTALVSAPADDISDIEQDTRGSVYFFGLIEEEGHDWLQIKKLSGSNENATLGSSIAVYEDTVFVGAPGGLVDGSKEQGLSGRGILEPTAAPSEFLEPTAEPSESEIPTLMASIRPSTRPSQSNQPSKGTAG